MKLTYRPNQPYQFNNLNELNPVVQPVPSETFDEDTDRYIVDLEAGTIFSLSDDSYGDHAFVAEISACQPLKLEQTISAWHYKQKAYAQDILPFLFLGPLAAARDACFIRSNNITMLVAVRDGNAAAVNPNIMNPARFNSVRGVETAIFDISSELDLIQRFRPVIKQMNDHLQERSLRRPIATLNDVGGKILVFCEAGDRRSPALVVLYLIVVFGVPSQSAIQAVQARRFGIFLSGDLIRMIRNCEDLLQAEKQVAMANSRLAACDKPTHSKLQKRRMYANEAEDEEMDDMQDNEGISRTRFVAFEDVDA